MTKVLSGKRILVVEDEYFIADDLKQALNDAGAVVVGPVSSLDPALAIARSHELDAAVLDVNLGGSFSYRVADVLAAAAVPYVFVTGYDDWAMPAEYQRTPRIAKPFTDSDVVDAVDHLCSDGAAR